MKVRLKNKAEQKSFKFRTCGGHDRSADCMRRRKQRSRQSCSECKSSVHRFHYTEYGDTPGDYTDLTASIRVLTNRTDIVDTVYKGYAEQFMELYPNITVEYEGMGRLHGYRVYRRSGFQE